MSGKLNNNELKSSQVIKPAEDSSKYPIKIPNRKTLKAKDILRIQSQLISGFIKGEITDEFSKTLMYLTNGYINSLKTVEIEKRLEILEEFINAKT